jgi:hypothetical protein
MIDGSCFIASVPSVLRIARGKRKRIGKTAIILARLEVQLGRGDS